MIKIESGAWDVMVSHARQQFPNECCGVMIGSAGDGVKTITRALAMENAYQGGQEDRYEIRPEDLLRADRDARKDGLELIGIFHSHPDCDAYFSQTDLQNSCPWYSFVVLSIKNGEFDHANSFLPNADQTAAEKEELVY
ncbi:MAG: M67 family metallopeptidase [Acidobacteria bacterium]|nr:M67 family metallopeptidase [Acidobacteriota bacterium]